ncbi:hypothetical protein TYRP_006955 [Tyrophagus putrescentiae]|nr:hypothetical protein TYRP_006955 [Tyrophagus putrescentiae]
MFESVGIRSVLVDFITTLIDIITTIPLTGLINGLLFIFTIITFFITLQPQLPNSLIELQCTVVQRPLQLSALLYNNGRTGKLLLLLLSHHHHLLLDGVNPRLQAIKPRFELAFSSSLSKISSWFSSFFSSFSSNLDRDFLDGSLNRFQTGPQLIEALAEEANVRSIPFYFALQLSHLSTEVRLEGGQKVGGRFLEEEFTFEAVISLRNASFSVAISASRRRPSSWKLFPSSAAEVEDSFFTSFTSSSSSSSKKVNFSALGVILKDLLNVLVLFNFTLLLLLIIIFLLQNGQMLSKPSQFRFEELLTRQCFPLPLLMMGVLQTSSSSSSSSKKCRLPKAADELTPDIVVAELVSAPEEGLTPRELPPPSSFRSKCRFRKPAHGQRGDQPCLGDPQQMCLEEGIDAEEFGVEDYI